MAHVEKLAHYRNRELIETLEDLLQMARNGEIYGLMFAVKKFEGDHLLGSAGSYSTDMMGAIAASARLMYLANRKCSRIWDATASDI